MSSPPVVEVDLAVEVSAVFAAALGGGCARVAGVRGGGSAGKDESRMS